jgi:hypothetical protein
MTVKLEDPRRNRERQRVSENEIKRKVVSVARVSKYDSRTRNRTPGLRIENCRQDKMMGVSEVRPHVIFASHFLIIDRDLKVQVLFKFPHKGRNYSRSTDNTTPRGILLRPDRVGDW